MKVLMLCGYFAQENEEEVVRHARYPVEFSANAFQRKLIGGFRSAGIEPDVVSAPFIGSFPNACDMPVFRGFEAEQEECRYVGFNNIWGIRNLSRSRALKKAVKAFAEDPADEKLILVYCPHTPFLEAAVYAKKTDPRIRICMYVPDLPNYMNLRADRSRIYDAAKSVDIRRMHRLMECVDGYVLLTAPMRDMLPVGDKPCLIREGIVSDQKEAEPCVPQAVKYVVYTGKMDAKFGIPQLLEGFCGIRDETYRLVLCGSGDCDGIVRQAAAADRRIQFLGQVSPAEALSWQKRAAVLVNPRPNREEYTKYSFPSKNIEYLLSGRPVAAYMLDGMPEIYSKFIYAADPDLPEDRAIADAVCRAVQDDADRWKARYEAFTEYAQATLSARAIAQAILDRRM